MQIEVHTGRPAAGHGSRLGRAQAGRRPPGAARRPEQAARRAVGVQPLAPAGVRLHPRRQALERPALRRLPGRHRRATSPSRGSSSQRFEAIDTTGFPEQEALNKELMVRDLRDGIEGVEVQGLADAGQPDRRHPPRARRSSPSLLPFTTAKDYDDYITRCKQAARGDRPDDRHHAPGHGRRADAAEVPAGEGGDAGRAASPPRKPEKSPFAAAARRSSPTTIPEAEQERIRDADARRHPRLASLPAYAKFAKFVQRGVRAARAAPRSACGRCRTARPATPARVKQSTTTDLTAGGDPPDRPARGGAHRGRDAGDRQEARLQPT